MPERFFASREQRTNPSWQREPWQVPPIAGIEFKDFVTALDSMKLPLDPSVVTDVQADFNKPSHLKVKEYSPEEITQIIKGVRYENLCEVAQSLGRFDIAEIVFNEMVQNVPESGLFVSDYEKARNLFLTINAEYAAVFGRFEEANKFIQEIQDKAWQQLAYTDTSDAALEAGYLTFAYKTLTKGIEQFGYSDSLSDFSYVNIAREVAKRGKFNLAQRIARKSKDILNYEVALQVIIEEQVNHGLLEDAKSLAQTIEEPELRANSLNLVGSALKDFDLLSNALSSAFEAHRMRHLSDNTVYLGIGNSLLEFAKSVGYVVDISKYLSQFENPSIYTELIVQMLRDDINSFLEGQNTPTP